MRERLRKNPSGLKNRRRNRLRHHGKPATCNPGGAGGFACQWVFPQPGQLTGL